ncbi:MAG: transcription antitermination factor NusB [Verrucomicrobiia bacterium]|jgi:N utilization substance protein B
MEKPVKPGGTRRHARELAAQFLYQHDLGGGGIEEELPFFWQTQPEAGGAARKFAEELIHGCVEHRTVVDEKIQKYTEHWELSRIAAVDRNILRLAIYEMLFRDDIPPVVSINEAVDIAKKYSTQESGAFVNGILDRLKADLTRPARTTAGKAE